MTTAWILDRTKYLNEIDVRRLLQTAEQILCEGLAKRKRIAVNDYLLITLGLYTGLRVEEISRLCIGDLEINATVPSLIVQNGKGGKRRRVRLGVGFAKKLLDFQVWKKAIGEPTEKNSPLLLSAQTGQALTVRALQKAFKRTAKKAGLHPDYSIHCLRHSYASFLYRAGNFNLRFVQSQLGHSSLAVTEVYTHLIDNQAEEALDKLYGEF